jgi:hypothetical protein
VSTHFTWHRFAAIQIWIFVLFLVYTCGEELNARLGRGELMKLLFTGHSPEVKPTRPAADWRALRAQPHKREHTPSMSRQGSIGPYYVSEPLRLR